MITWAVVGMEGVLVQLAEAAKMSEIAQRFREAMMQEEEHLVTVRGWVHHLTLHPSEVRPAHDFEPSTPQASGAE